MGHAGGYCILLSCKTAIQTIRRLEKEVRSQFLPGCCEYADLLNDLQRGKTIYERYGGKIFAVGCVVDRPFYDGEAVYEKQHWKSRVYVRIEKLRVLQSPIPIEAFNSFLMISRQSSITPVLGHDYERLKSLIFKQNPNISDDLENSVATPFPLRDIHEENWLTLTAAYHRAFQLETAFRTFYVNYFLRAIADKRTFYRECECKIQGHLSGYVDNCIWLNGKLCFVEVKLNWDAERDLMKQLEKYCNADEVWLSRDLKMPLEKWVNRWVIIVDRERVGLYDHRVRQIFTVAELDTIRDRDDLGRVRMQIIKALESDT